MDKESKKIEIDYKEYLKMVRMYNYVINWYPNYQKCKVCGEYSPKGCICINCCD